MSRAVRTIGLGLFAAVCLTIAGCAGQSEAARGQHPIPTAEAIKRASREPKPADLPSLPDGAGELDEDVPLELIPTGTGLYYRVLRKGSGKQAGIFNEVLAHYQGSLADGKVFDSSYKRKEPIRFPLSGPNSVIKGWREGIQLIEEGGMIELEIPPDLAYGAKGRPPVIPENSTLHFIIELEKVY